MKTIWLLLLCVTMAFPAYAADAPAAGANTQGQKAPDKAGGADKPAQAKPGQDAVKPEANPNQLSCKYYTVDVPDDWKTIVAPTDQQGTVNAIFAKNTGNPQITMIIGPNGGASAQDIASMFAEQFKAAKPPVEKNGQYCFNYSQMGATSQACISVQDEDFMVIAITGNQKEALNFIKNNIKSENYSGMFPK